MNVSNIRNERIRRAIAALPADQVAALEAAGEMVVKQDPYYSKVRISPSLAKVGSVTTFTMAKGDLTCFDYGQGDPLTNAGFSGVAPYDKATYSDTNLLSKSETNGAEFMFIDGVSALLSPRSEYEVVRQCFPELYCSASLSGQQGLFKFGCPLFIPGGGGIFGGGESRMLLPNNQDNRAIVPGAPSNGLPGVLDYKQLQDPILWGGKGKVDSTFVFTLSMTRTITWTATDRAVDLANNITAWTPPAAQYADGAFAELWIVLHGIQLAPRGRNR